MTARMLLLAEVLVGITGASLSFFLHPTSLSLVCLLISIVWIAMKLEKYSKMARRERFDLEDDPDFITFCKGKSEEDKT